MRKYLFLLAAGMFCLMAGRAMAQPMFVLRGGINSSWHSGKGTNESGSLPVVGDYSLKQSSILRQDAGMYFLFPLIRNMLAFQPGVDYYGGGTRQKSKSVVGEYKETIMLNYISLPVLFRLAYAREAMRIYVAAGPYASYALNGKAELEGNSGTTIKQDVDFDSSNVRRMDLGAVVGAGVMFRVGPVWLGADLRYRKGFANLNTDDDSKDDYQPMHNSLSPTINLFIPLGKEKY